MMGKCQAEVGALRGKKVIVTGHSLGGALSLFMTLKLWQASSLSWHEARGRRSTQWDMNGLRGPHAFGIEASDFISTHDARNALSIAQDMNTLPKLALGWAGPFIG